MCKERFGRRKQLKWTVVRSCKGSDTYTLRVREVVRGVATSGHLRDALSGGPACVKLHEGAQLVFAFLIGFDERWMAVALRATVWER